MSLRASQLPEMHIALRLRAKHDSKKKFLNKVEIRDIENRAIYSWERVDGRKEDHGSPI